MKGFCSSKARQYTKGRRDKVTDRYKFLDTRLLGKWHPGLPSLRSPCKEPAIGELCPHKADCKTFSHPIVCIYRSRAAQDVARDTRTPTRPKLNTNECVCALHRIKTPRQLH